MPPDPEDPPIPPTSPDPADAPDPPTSPDPADAPDPPTSPDPADASHPEDALPPETETVSEPPAETRSARHVTRHRRGDMIRAGIRGVGQTLVTLGLVVLLFVVYEVWVTNIFAEAKQHDVKQALTQQWTAGQDPLQGEDKLQLPAGKQVVLPAGKGFANLYVPALGSDYAYTIVQGTNEADLEKGPGHYEGTAIPGQVGNFAVAGHRVGKGEPFLNLDQLVPGNAVVVQTASNWYIYKVLGDPKTGDLSVKDAQGVPGREIVSPSQVSVIDPVPDSPGKTPTQVMMTMTTCHPKYSADKRMIVHALLDRAVAKSGDETPKELGGTL
jgi:sortase A